MLVRHSWKSKRFFRFFFRGGIHKGRNSIFLQTKIIQNFEFGSKRIFQIFTINRIKGNCLMWLKKLRLQVQFHRLTCGLVRDDLVVLIFFFFLVFLILAHNKPINRPTFIVLKDKSKIGLSTVMPF